MVKCRVCDGSGKKFVEYPNKKGYGTTSKEYPCRACNGSGVNYELNEKFCENGYCGEKIIYPSKAEYPPKYCKSCKAKIQAEKAEKAKQWQTKSCPGLGTFGICGNQIKYNTTWSNIPTLCPSCIAKAKEEKKVNQAKWKEKFCPGYNGSCGKTIKYNIDWEYPPVLCPDCKEKKKKEKDEKDDRNKRIELARSKESIYREKGYKKGVEIVAEKGSAQTRSQSLVQNSEDGVTVKVKSGWSFNLQTVTTDVLVFVKGTYGHYHIVFDEHGDTLIDEWRDK